MRTDDMLLCGHQAAAAVALGKEEGMLGDEARDGSGYETDREDSDGAEASTAAVASFGNQEAAVLAIAASPDGCATNQPRYDQ